MSVLTPGGSRRAGTASLGWTAGSCRPFAGSPCSLVGPLPPGWIPAWPRAPPPVTVAMMLPFPCSVQRSTGGWPPAVSVAASPQPPGCAGREGAAHSEGRRGGPACWGLPAGAPVSPERSAHSRPRAAGLGKAVCRLRGCGVTAGEVRPGQAVLVFLDAAMPGPRPRSAVRTALAALGLPWPAGRHHLRRRPEVPSRTAAAGSRGDVPLPSVSERDVAAGDPFLRPDAEMHLPGGRPDAGGVLLLPDVPLAPRRLGGRGEASPESGSGSPPSERLPRVGGGRRALKLGPPRAPGFQQLSALFRHGRRSLRRGRGRRAQEPCLPHRVHARCAARLPAAPVPLLRTWPSSPQSVCCLPRAGAGRLLTPPCIVPGGCRQPGRVLPGRRPPGAGPAPRELPGNTRNPPSFGHVQCASVGLRSRNRERAPMQAGFLGKPGSHPGPMSRAGNSQSSVPWEQSLAPQQLCHGGEGGERWG